MLALVLFFFQAEDGIRDLVRSRGLGDVYKRQGQWRGAFRPPSGQNEPAIRFIQQVVGQQAAGLAIAAEDEDRLHGLSPP